MNKHLKPGVAVDVRGASDEVKEQVMAAFVAAGAKINKFHGQIDPDFKNYAYWDRASVAWFTVLPFGELITINQALGRESEVENTWFDRGELPPVGTVCEVQAHNTIWGFKDCDAHICEVIATHGDNAWLKVDNQRLISTRFDKCDFRPLKTEKEKFVERIGNEWLSQGKPLDDFMRDQYDKGLRFTE